MRSRLRRQRPHIPQILLTRPSHPLQHLSCFARPLSRPDLLAKQRCVQRRPPVRITHVHVEPLGTVQREQLVACCRGESAGGEASSGMVHCVLEGGDACETSVGGFGVVGTLLASARERPGTEAGLALGSWKARVDVAVGEFLTRLNGADGGCDMRWPMEVIGKAGKEGKDYLGLAGVARNMEQFSRITGLTLVCSHG